MNGVLKQQSREEVTAHREFLFKKEKKRKGRLTYTQGRSNRRYRTFIGERCFLDGEI